MKLTSKAMRLRDSVGKIAASWEGYYYHPGQQAQCAQFVRAVFDEAGIKLPSAANPSDILLLPGEPIGATYANSFAGNEVGEKVSKTDLQPGDIVMWANTYGDWPLGVITHVGVVNNEGRIVHRPTASAPVASLATGALPWPIAEVRRPYWEQLSTGKEVEPTDFMPLKMYYHNGVSSILQQGKATRQAILVKLYRHGDAASLVYVDLGSGNAIVYNSLSLTMNYLGPNGIVTVSLAVDNGDVISAENVAPAMTIFLKPGKNAKESLISVYDDYGRTLYTELVLGGMELRAW